MRSHQNDVAALEQWTPLIHKIAYKAAQRAAAIDFPMLQSDFAQELSITVLKCHDSFDPNMGVKMITFLYRAMYNEVNKIFGKEEANRKLSQHVEEYRDKDGKISKRIVNDIGFNISGDSTYDDEGAPQGIWDHVPDEQASPESNVMEDQLMDFVHANISPEASAILCILESQNSFVTDQLIAYNRGVEEEAMLGGIRRFTLDMDFSFVCKMLGINHAKAKMYGNQVKSAIAKYGN